MRYTLVVTTFSLLLLLASNHAHCAPNLPAIKKELSDLGSKLKEQESSLRMLNEQLANLKSSQKTYQQQAEKIKRGKAKLDQDYENANKKIAEELKKFEPIQEEIKKLQGKTFSRMRATYVHSPKNVFSNLFQSPEARELGLLRSSVYLAAIREHDGVTLNAFKDQLKLRDLKIAEIEKAKETRSTLELEIEDQERQLQEQMQWEAELGLKLADQRRQVESARAELAGKYSKVQSYLDRLTATSSAARSLRNELSRSEAGAKVVEKQSAGAGLSSVKGRLPWPVQDYDVLRGYGKYKEEGIKEALMSKGLELQATPQAAISSVFEGQVIFSGQMPGFGLVIILDHGARYYTVYGKLSSVFISLGQMVKQGSKIGATSYASAGQSNFYFEIRENGVAKDPLPFLSKQN